MKIYVAAKLENKEQVRATHELLRQYGHEITLDWTQEPGREGLNPMDQHALMEEWGAKEMQAVENCDVFLQFPHEKSKGAYAELGMAIAWGKPVLIVEPENYIHCIFFHVQGSYFIEREAAQSAAKLDFALRAVTGKVPLPVIVVAAFGPSAPMVQRISFRRLPETMKPGVSAEILARVSAFKELVATLPLDNDSDKPDVMVKRLPYGCGLHFFRASMEALTDIEALHGPAGLAQIALGLSKCDVCEFNSQADQR